MKTAAVIVASLASASAFAPSQVARTSTTLEAAKEKKPSFFSTVFGMDLFAPNQDVNDYGARGRKNVGTGKLSDNSYVPDGLTRAQYEAQRSAADKKKADNYQKNVAKAGKFLDYTQFYIDRGTDTNEKWNKDINKGHRMAKTKFDWSGKQEEAKQWFTK